VPTYIQDLEKVHQLGMKKWQKL